MEGEATVAGRGLAFGASQGIFLLRHRVQEHREILADRPETLVYQGFRRGADDHEVAVGARQAEQFITHRPADAVDVHAYLAS